MSYAFNFDIHIFDTDCYGVVWHGSYTKWLEMGRVNYFKTLGVDMKTMSDDYDIIFPVVEQNLKFKAPGKLGDVMRLTTDLVVEGPKLVFTQTIHNLHTDKLIIDSKTDVVMINSQGRMYRKMPDIMTEKLAALSS